MCWQIQALLQNSNVQKQTKTITGRIKRHEIGDWVKIEDLLGGVLGPAWKHTIWSARKCSGSQAKSILGRALWHGLPPRHSACDFAVWVLWGLHGGCHLRFSTMKCFLSCKLQLTSIYQFIKCSVDQHWKAKRWPVIFRYFCQSGLWGFFLSLLCLCMAWLWKWPLASSLGHVMN